MSNEFDVFEQARLFLPKYLSPEQTRDLYTELSRFPNIDSFYLDREDLRGQLLQGDGWRGFIAINFETGDRKLVSGVIISNSCDIATENSRNIPVNILFAPLINLARYVERLRASGKPEGQIENILNSIRSQKVTSIFYLPGYPGVIDESLILLDDIHAQPLADFLGRERVGLFKLSQTFFYIFIIKLSIHFSRFNEDIQRFVSSG